MMKNKLIKFRKKKSKKKQLKTNSYMKNYLMQNHFLKILHNKIKYIVCKINKIAISEKYF